MPDPVAAYEAMLTALIADPNVVGVVVTGSRGADRYVSARSDVDLRVVTTAPDQRWSTPHGSPVEAWAMTLEAFREHGMAGTPTAWDRPTFLRVRIDLDRTDGEIAALVERKARLDGAEAAATASAALDEYLNSLVRSLRNLEAGRSLEGRLDANESVAPLLTALFAIEARVRPYNKWLGLELQEWPLRLTDPLALVDRLGTDPSTGDQRAVFATVEPIVRAAGHGGVVDGWAPELDWLRRGP